MPKLGFHNSDAWCETRAGILSEMEHWGIETFFSICVTAAEHLPELDNHLFVWPNFIDPRVYTDYGETKNIDILLTGAQHAQYPWRRKVFAPISQHFHTQLLSHPGYYFVPGAATNQVYGEAYARALNASHFVPTCGTVAKEVVRKHFEIPACRACLVTERSPGLEAAGFRDMVNCVFADENDAVEKIRYLLSHPGDLERISSAGYELVHTRHTFRQRNQIIHWWRLQETLTADKKIIQPNPFEPPIAVNNSFSAKASFIVSNGLHLRLLNAGNNALWIGQCDNAAASFIECMRYTEMLPEPKLGLALCELYKGQIDTAFSRLMDLVEYTLAGYRAFDPDPVEWAYLCAALLCLGNVRGAARWVRSFPDLRHIALDRIRANVATIEGKSDDGHPLSERGSSSRRSVHRLPLRSADQWDEELARMLVACGQPLLADRLRKRQRATASIGPAGSVSEHPHGQHPAVLQAATERRMLPRPSRSLEGAWLFLVGDPLLYFRLRRKVRRIAAKLEIVVARLTGHKRSGLLPQKIRLLGGPNPNTDNTSPRKDIG